MVESKLSDESTVVVKSDAKGLMSRRCNFSTIDSNSEW